MSLMMLAGAIFLAPGAIALSSCVVSIAAAAADLLTHRRPAFVRLGSIAAGTAGAAALWSVCIVWIIIHTSLLPTVARPFGPVVALTIGSMPVIRCLRDLPPEADGGDRSEDIERPALLTGGLLNAVFLVVALA